jgi:hypothetical protein
VCGVIEPGLAQHLAALNAFTVHAAQQRADIVARLALVEQLAEHLNTRAGRLLRVGRMPTISISSPTLMMPCSTRPVTTVPRPEIENTSSTGIRNGLSSGRSGVGMYSSTAAISSRILSLPMASSRPSTAASAEPATIGMSSPGKS